MRIIYIFTLLCLPLHLLAQELLCNVTINMNRVQTQEKQLYNNLKNDIQTFINTTKWTEEVFEPEEKIKCDILLILKSNSSINFIDAEVQIQAKRPVYNTQYETKTFFFFDQSWQFSYNTSQPLFFTENSYSTELTALLAYFSYLIIGMDYDSFGTLSGNVYIEKAMNILNFSQQSSNDSKWRQGDNRNRYWLAYQLGNIQFEDFRKGIYQYYRLGLDQLSEKPESARRNIIQALASIEKTAQFSRMSILINSWMEAKKEEMIKIFSKARENEKEEFLKTVKNIDPGSYSNYKKNMR